MSLKTCFRGAEAAAPGEAGISLDCTRRSSSLVPGFTRVTEFRVARSL